jgi:hypothetical protein
MAQPGGFAKFPIPRKQTINARKCPIATTGFVGTFSSSPLFRVSQAAAPSGVPHISFAALQSTPDAQVHAGMRDDAPAVMATPPLPRRINPAAR